MLKITQSKPWTEGRTPHQAFAKKTQKKEIAGEKKQEF